MLAEDIKVREYLKAKLLKNAAVSRILIERPAKNARITVYRHSPGGRIGAKGEDTRTRRRNLLLPMRREHRIAASSKSMPLTPTASRNSWKADQRSAAP